jgi:phosphatidylinositol 4-kinase
MQLFKTIFESVGLELWLRPYRVIANRSGADKTIGGIIECVPNAQSRAEMGQATGVSLRQHFLNKYDAGGLVLLLFLCECGLFLRVLVQGSGT